MSADTESETSQRRSGPRIGMVLKGHYPPDVRVEKEVRVLVAAGYDVSLLCLGGDDDPERERVGGATVTRFRRQEKYGLLQRGVKTLAYTATLSDRIWRRELVDFVETDDVDVLHVHDLPLVQTAQDVADEYGLPVVADLHENYPEAVRQWRRGMPRWRRGVQTVVAPVWRLKRLERRAVARADRVLTVAEEARAHYLRDCGADPRTVSVVSNTVDLDVYDPERVAPIESGRGDAAADDEFVVGYVGSFGPHRGIETAIRAFPAVVDAVPNARLLLVGGSNEPGYDQGLRELAAETGVGDRITFTGWVDAADVPGFMAACDVGLVPHVSNAHTETTVPHKLFQYMALSVPVVATDVGPLGRIVRDAGGGRVVPASDPAAMATALAALGDDAELRDRLGESARRAVVDRYAWADDAETLVALYDDLTGA
ncbi:glycosyltransferase family 4 protein [Halogeometricum limi]|uniref:Glycosyltransferase involved in cell wall bisynthesis n=1 Tax=Halogeometricum limi TaxID=555875 RepID=A0A1I6HTV9_9EURY|nr:glycosyltransferase family 4 protein [Halogeometricum limi]SFR57838.1 Glycosyltransferase involved in cell wall bisynthesis [Halogeometricum limi]